jgi:hypothetical protein
MMALKEPESRTSRLNSWSDFINVIAENAEADILSVSLDYCH